MADLPSFEEFEQLPSPKRRELYVSMVRRLKNATGVKSTAAELDGLRAKFAACERQVQGLTEELRSCSEATKAMTASLCQSCIAYLGNQGLLRDDGATPITDNVKLHVHVCIRASIHY